LANCSAQSRIDFLRDLGTAQAAARHGIVPSRADANDRTWKLWASFCRELLVDPWLLGVGDPILLLQVFAHRYRVGQIAPSGRQVKSRTVEGALRAVGQAFTALGSPDPRLTATGSTEFRLSRQLRSYSKLDPPPQRVKPIPVDVIHHMMALSNQHGTADSLAIADLIALAFFFLLRPGEYTAPRGENTPFKLEDVQFYVGLQRCSALTAPPDMLLRATFVTLTFTTQKNAVRNEVIGLGRSGNPHTCPVAAAARRVLHLRDNNATAATPLCTYYMAGSPHFVTPADISITLKSSVRALGPALGFLQADVSARSLRAAGAMALLCAHVDSDTIRLLGRWRSDEMLRYLTVQAQPIMRNFARMMLQGGRYTLLPNQDVPLVAPDNPQG
jgi:hypothetical protein